MNTCPECSKDFKEIGTHWRWNPEHRPSISGDLKEIVKGTVMGDACVNDNGGNPCLKLSVIREEYLKYLDELFGPLSRGVELDRTAEELAKQNEERGFSTTVNKENYSDVYIWHTVNHPDLTEFREWYSSGEKDFPNDLELTPTSLKHWYVCDGTLSHGRYIQLYTSVQNKKKVSELFEKKFGISPNIENQYYLYFTREQSRVLFNIMGDSLPGFHYKWPNGDTP